MQDIFLLDDIEHVAQIMTKGGVILYPTDTIWGIGCNAFDERAVEKIYEIKHRDRSKPLILLVDSVPMLKSCVSHIHPRIETLLVHHTRPLTIIYDHPSGIPEYLLAPTKTIAIRVVKDHFCKLLIKSMGRPLVSTSANVQGEPFPAHFGEISSQIIEKMDYVVKYRQDDKRPSEPSVVATYNKKGELEFLRE